MSSRIIFICLFWCALFWAAGCGDILPPSEQAQERVSGQDASTDKTPPLPRQEAAQEPPQERLAQEPAQPDQAPDASTRDTKPGEERPSKPEPSPEANVPDASPQETAPEIMLSPVAAKALSLRSSFLQDQLQKGLMDRPQKDATTWSLELVVPAGTHRFSFCPDGKSTGCWGDKRQAGLPGSQGRLFEGQTGTLTLAKRARIKWQANLQTRTWSLTQRPAPTKLSLQGSWSGKSNQLATLTQQSDGLFVLQWTLKAGAASWSFQADFSTQKERWGPLYPPHQSFPQGGTLQATTSTQYSTSIPSDGTYELHVDTLARRYTLRATSGDAVTAWNNLLQQVSQLPSPQKEQQISAFLAQRRAWMQLPLRHQNKVVFVVKWQASAAVHVAGSFNQWDTSATPMTRITGTDVYYKEMSLPVGHHEYKFLQRTNPPQWELDPNNPAIVYGSLGPNSAIQQGQANQSQLHWYKKFKATKLNNTRDIWVYLPADYNHNKTRRYPVLYMHDGQNLFDPKAIFGGWDVGGWMDKLDKQGSAQAAIIVGVANTPGRMEEYTHVKDKLSGGEIGGKAKDYADLLIQDLKPWIDGHYRTLPGRRQTGTMGSSLGGLVSLWLGVSYPDVFYRIGALSSTFGWGKLGASNPTLLDTVSAMSWRNLIIYLDSGSPKDNFQETIQMRDLLEKKGYLHDLNLRHWTETGAGHNEQEWRKRLDKPLTFLLH